MRAGTSDPFDVGRAVDRQRRCCIARRTRTNFPTPWRALAPRLVPSGGCRELIDLGVRRRLDLLDQAHSRRASRVGKDTVARLWKKRRLRPRKVDVFKLSTDPNFESKLVDIVALYMCPPDHLSAHKSQPVRDWLALPAQARWHLQTATRSTRHLDRTLERQPHTFHPEKRPSTSNILRNSLPMTPGIVTPPT